MDGWEWMWLDEGRDGWREVGSGGWVVWIGGGRKEWICLGGGMGKVGRDGWGVDGC